MGLLLSNCLKGMQDDFPLPYRRSSSRRSQLQALLSNKSNPDVDGRKMSSAPPLPDQSSWGRPSTPQGADDSPGPPTPSSGTSGHFGYPFSSSQGAPGSQHMMSQGTSTGPTSYNKERPRKVSFNFQSGKSDKNYM